MSLIPFEVTRPWKISLKEGLPSFHHTFPGVSHLSLAAHLQPRVWVDGNCPHPSGSFLPPNARWSSFAMVVAFGARRKENDQPGRVYAVAYCPFPLPGFAVCGIVPIAPFLAAATRPGP